MGYLLVLMPSTSFLGGLFWSQVVDRTGSYRRVLTGTSLAGSLVVFGYMLPQITNSLPLLLVITALHGPLELLEMAEKCTRFLTATAGPLVDGLCLKVLAEQDISKEAYGDQRLWSAVGWGVMALLAGKLVESWSKACLEGPSEDIYGSNCIFFCYASLVLLNVLVIQLFIQDSAPDHEGSTKVRFSESTEGY